MKKMEIKNKNVSITLPPHIYDMIKEKAKLEKRSMSFILREIIIKNQEK